MYMHMHVARLIHGAALVCQEKRGVSIHTGNEFRVMFFVVTQRFKQPNMKIRGLCFAAQRFFFKKKGSDDVRAMFASCFC